MVWKIQYEYPLVLLNSSIKSVAKCPGCDWAKLYSSWFKKHILNLSILVHNFTSWIRLWSLTMVCWLILGGRGGTVMSSWFVLGGGILLPLSCSSILSGCLQRRRTSSFDNCFGGIGGGTSSASSAHGEGNVVSTLTWEVSGKWKKKMIGISNRYTVYQYCINLSWINREV